MEIRNRITVDVHWDVVENDTVVYVGCRTFDKYVWDEMSEADLLKIQTDDYTNWQTEHFQG
jgi:anaerobic ribonucleoside-triphosphate reductase